MYRTDDTIAAVSSAAGAGARAIVRVSGPAAMDLAAEVFASVRAALTDVGGFCAVDGRVVLGALELPARAYVFRAPRSYTRQDVVELHVPGSPDVAQWVLDALLSGGARQAEPGEFTARAFFSGRIDLSQAEAVADVISAADDARLRSGLAGLGGAVRTLAESAAARATEALALVEASIDMAEEDIELVDPADLAGRLHSLAANLRDLAAKAGTIAETGTLPTVVLAGRPNVGKSSLLNALAGTDRAITSALAGTTRDVLSAPVELPGRLRVLLIDAAGFCPSDDALDLEADAAARRAVSSADVLLLVVDASRPSPDADAILADDLHAANRRASRLVLRNKMDRSARASEVWPDGPDVLDVSAATGLGLDTLRTQLAELLATTADRAADGLGLHERHKRALHASADAADRAADLLAPADTTADVAELAAVELRDVLAGLAQISGQVVTEDILGVIFARFCVGK